MSTSKDMFQSAIRNHNSRYPIVGTLSPTYYRSSHGSIVSENKKRHWDIHLSLIHFDFKCNFKNQILYFCENIYIYIYNIYIYIYISDDKSGKMDVFDIENGWDKYIGTKKVIAQK